MKCVLGYVGKEMKTVKEDRKYVTGINCDPAHAYDEMMLTKKVHRKTGGRLYYHLVQSFPKGYDITPEKAHQIALEFAQRAFGQYECVVATHIDREHIHSHIVFNSVSFDTGKKYHSDKDNPLKLMNLSDEICRPGTETEATKSSQDVRPRTPLRRERSERKNAAAVCDNRLYERGKVKETILPDDERAVRHQRQVEGQSQAHNLCHAEQVLVQRSPPAG